MTALPATVARCPGVENVNQAAWPFPRPSHGCEDCARRTQAIADYMSGRQVEWMTPPVEAPCVEQLKPKGKAL